MPPRKKNQQVVNPVEKYGIDPKVQNVVERLYEAIKKGTYTEIDVAYLLMLLREDAPRDSCVRELADFIAHREKDRGSIHQYVLNVWHQIKAFASGKSASWAVAVVFTVDDLQKSMNECFNRFGLDPLDKVLFVNVVGCIISILQSVSLVEDNGNIFGALYATLEPEEFKLVAYVTITEPKFLYIIFETLKIPNNFYPLPSDTNLELSHSCWAHSTDGRFEIDNLDTSRAVKPIKPKPPQDP